MDVDMARIILCNNNQQIWKVTLGYLILSQMIKKIKQGKRKERLELGVFWYSLTESLGLVKFCLSWIIGLREDIWKN